MSETVCFAQGVPDGKGRPVVVSFPNSDVLLNAFATFAAWSLLYFFVTRYILERLVPRIWGKLYTEMSWPDRRSYVCHHLWILVKTSAIIPGLLAIIQTIFLDRDLHAPVVPGSPLSNADIFSVLCEPRSSALSLTRQTWRSSPCLSVRRPRLRRADRPVELTYRARVSPVTLLHHVAAIVLAQWQIAGEVNGVALTNPMPRVLNSRGFDSQFILIMICAQTMRTQL